MIIPMAAEAGQVLFILTAFVSSTIISGSEFITLEPRNVNMVAGTWREKFTCTVRPRKSGRHRYLSSENLTFQFTSNLGGDHTIPDSCTRIVNVTTLEMSYCPLVDEERSANTDWLACLLKHDNDEYVEAYVTIKDRHAVPQILETEVYNWDLLSFLVETNENQARMYNMTYAAWFWNDSATSTVRKCRMERINATVLKATVKDPFRVSHPNDYLTIKVNGTAFGLPKDFPNKIVEELSTDELRLSLKQFVRPAKVSRIDVVHRGTPTTILLEPPKPNRNITYNIVIKCDKDFNSRAVNVTRKITVNCPPINDTQQSTNNVETHCRISKNLTDLPAFSTCIASVRAIPVAGGIWSEWNRYKFETPESIPLRNPEICSNCFSIRPGNTPDNSVSDVIVYFTPLSEKEAQGKIVLYRIRIFDKNFSNESFQYLDNTENSRYSFLLRNLSHRIDYEIGIEAKTSKGYYSGSPNISNTIGVSRSHFRSISFPKNFLVIMLNYTAVRASWNLDENVCGTEMKISLFWCNGHFRTKTCTSVLNLKSISPGVTSDIIAVSGGEPIFGIGMECDGKSSGIVWNECVYDIDKNPSEPSIQSIVPFDSGITIVFGNDSGCSSTGRGPGLTVAYRISYCQILRNFSNIDGNCLDSWTTLTLSRSAGKSLTVSGLNENRRYRLSIRSLSENNRTSQEVNSTTYIFPAVTNYSMSGTSNSSGSFKSSVLISAVLAVLAFLVTIAVVVYCRNYVKSEIPITISQPVVVKGAQTVSMRVESSGHHVIDPYAVLAHKNYAESVESGDSSQPETENLTFNLPNDFIGTEEEEDNRASSTNAERIPIFPNPFSRIYPDEKTQGSKSTLAFEKATLQKIFQSVDRQFEEANAARILPSVFGTPDDNAVETDCKVTSYEQQCPHMTPYELQESSAEAYSPPSSDYASGNDDYMCVTHENPDSSRSDGSSVGEDSGVGYTDGSARLALAMQPPPAGPAQSLVDECTLDDGLVEKIRSSPAVARSRHRSTVALTSSEDNDAIEDYIESLVACQSASISDSNMLITEEGFFTEQLFPSSNKAVAMQISAESSHSKCWSSMIDGGALGLSENVDGKTSLPGRASEEQCPGVQQDHRHVYPELVEAPGETEEFTLKPVFPPEEEEAYEFFPDTSIPVRYRRSDQIIESEDYRYKSAGILPTILLT